MDTLFREVVAAPDLLKRAPSFIVEFDDFRVSFRFRLCRDSHRFSVSNYDGIIEGIRLGVKCFDFS